MILIEGSVITVAESRRIPAPGKAETERKAATIPTNMIDIKIAGLILLIRFDANHQVS